MPKPVCVKCGLFYRPKRNGQVFEEGKPYRSSPDDIVRFTEQEGERNEWTGYKLWNADLWECKGCGNQIIVGAGARPMAEHFEDNYQERRTSYGGDAIPFVHDC